MSLRDDIGHITQEVWDEIAGPETLQQLVRENIRQVLSHNIRVAIGQRAQMAVVETVVKPYVVQRIEELRPEIIAVVEQKLQAAMQTLPEELAKIALENLQDMIKLSVDKSSREFTSRLVNAVYDAFREPTHE